MSLLKLTIINKYLHLFYPACYIFGSNGCKKHAYVRTHQNHIKLSKL